MKYYNRLTYRDKKVIKSIGKHKILSQPQIEYLYFPSYQTCQRRIREVLLPGRFINGPFYIEVKKDNSKIPLYRLTTKGKKLYKEMTGRKYYTPKWNIQYLPHLLETNWILILMSDIINNFELEKQIGPVQIDAYAVIKGIKTAIEVDLSETEVKSEIQRQFSNYEKLYTKGNYIDMLIYFTNRQWKLYEWTKEVAISDMPVKFVAREEDKLNKLKLYFTGCKMGVK